MQHKLYVITRKDLSKSQQAVQAGHALAEYLLNNRLTNWDNGTLVYLKVNNEGELKRLTNDLNWSNIPHVSFKEPDIGNQLTAIASLGGNEFFESMRLL